VQEGIPGEPERKPQSVVEQLESYQLSSAMTLLLDQPCYLQSLALMSTIWVRYLNINNLVNSEYDTRVLVFRVTCNHD
jgi:hypothetical protein